MTRKIVWAAVGLLFVAAPVAVFAQASGITDNCSSNETIQCLQSEITQLVQLLDLLLSQRKLPSQGPTTIDQSSLSQTSGSFAITGSTSAGKLLVEIVGSGYSGSNDYTSVSDLLKGGDNYNAVGNYVPSSGGRFNAPFNDVPSGVYTVYLYDGDNAPNWTFATSGTLTVNAANANVGSVSLTATNPIPVSASIVAGGTTGVTIGSFTLQPSGDNVNLQNIGLDLQAQQGSPADLVGGEAYVYQGTDLVGKVNFNGQSASTCPPAFTGVPAGGCYIATSVLSVPVALPQNTQSSFTIIADISPIGTGQSGTPGDEIVIGLSDAEGATAHNQIVHSGSAPSQVGVRIFKSYPTVTLLPDTSSLTQAVGKEPILIRFAVTAPTSGPIGIADIGENVAWSGVELGNITVSGFMDPGFSRAIPGHNGNGQLAIAALTGASTGSEHVDVMGSPTEPIEIPAGSTYYFQVNGYVTGITSDGQSITTTISGASSYLPLVSLTSGTPSEFTWSPNDNGTSQYSTVDWTNGFDVSGLPSVGLTQTITGQGVATTSPVITPPVATSTPPSPTPTPTSVTITANPMTVASGDRASVSWSSTNGAASCSYLSPNNAPSDYGYSGNAPTTGETGVGPLTSNATYDITCGGQTASVTITVTPPAANTPTCTESFSPSLVGAGQLFTDTWSSTGATSMTAVANLLGNPVLGPGPTGVNGSYETSYATPGTYDYTRTVTGAGGTGQCSSALVVLPNAASGPTATITANGQTSLTVPQGTSYTLAWSSTSASSCTLSWQGSGSVYATTSGSSNEPVNSQGSGSSGLIGTYTYMCTDASGKQASASVTISASAQSSAADQNANLANALTGLQSALQALESWLGSH